MSDKVYTVEQLAAVLGLSLPSVYRGLAEKKIPSIKLGKRYIIPRAAIEKWLESAGALPGTAVAIEWPKEAPYRA